MNIDSEQITLDKNLVIAQDQPLSNKELQDFMVCALGKDRCKIINIHPRRWAIEYRDGSKVKHFLIRSCTYLGNPHPIYKKRVQLPSWFNQYTKETLKSNPQIEVRYIGIYHFNHKDYGQNIIFIDFDTSTYLLKRGNNSSAHVYTNDLYQAMNYGVFRKIDYSGNTITTVRFDKFREYINGKCDHFGNQLFELFSRFNYGFSFGQWIKALDAIKEMHNNDWRHWRQAEWAGWFLEYRFNKFTIENQVTGKMRYIGSSYKRNGDLDFDISFDEANFYGDLKASDVKQNESPGNDQRNLTECILQYDRFWYIIYEHETIKDSETSGYMVTRDRNDYIKQHDSKYDKDPLSYHKRMKSEVRFVKMTIIELNRMNYREALTTFNQGHQSDGSSRNPKFNINKKVLKNDNFVVYRYSYHKYDE